MAIRFAEDPLFERVFTRMAEAAMAQASGQFFADLEHQMRSVLVDIVAEKGGAPFVQHGGQSSNIEVVSVRKTTWLCFICAFVAMVIFCAATMSWWLLHG